MPLASRAELDMVNTPFTLVDVSRVAEHPGGFRLPLATQTPKMCFLSCLQKQNL